MRRGVAIVALAALLAPVTRSQSETISLPAGCRGAAFVGGDPLRLLVATDDGIELRSLDAAAEPLASIPREDRRTLAFCVAGRGAAERVFVLDDGRALRTIDPRDGTVAVVLEDARSMLPSGVFALTFARDLDGDGDIDLALPQHDGFQLHYAVDGGFEKGPRVAHRVGIDVRIDGWREPRPSIRQSFRVPDFQVLDDNGDGVPDLSFRDRDFVQYFWSDRDGRLPREPTFVIDIEKLESALPKRQEGILDTGNLLSILDSRVSAFSRDVDGDGVADLLMQKGKNVLVYRGTREGVELGKPVAVLPTSGNLLAVALYDEDGDGRLDLFMLHVGDVSLAQVILWLVAGGELRIDLFVYRQEKPLSFARKPSSRRAVNLSLPAVSATIDRVRDVIDDLSEELLELPVVCDTDGDGVADDLAKLVDGRRIEIHENAAADLDPRDALSWIEVARRFDRDADGKSELTIGIEEAVAWLPLRGVELNERTRRAAPSEVIDLGTTALGERTASAMWATDLDADGRADFVVLERDAKTAPSKVILVRRAASPPR
jgi:hypothetical protein